ncbi:Alpha/Beta hydrolase protein [Pestalotiopsis sp. NC0098]|nr:Alpha/Beta hydrolase protein [Pestalotiopsis sp. NC0098]
MMATTQDQFITLGADVKINIVTTQTHVTGAHKPTLIFLHFWGGSSKTWSSMISLLSPTYPTLAIDFRGWGASTGPSRADAYSISDLAGDVQQVIRQRVVGDFVLVGHSMGAKVAQLLAGTYDSQSSNTKARLRAMVLVCPAPPTPLVLPDDMKDQQIHAYDNAGSAEFVVRNVLTASQLDQHTVDGLVQDMLRGNSHARAAWPAYAMGEDIRSGGWRVEVPGLVIAAEDDVVEPLERIRTEVVPHIKQAEFAIIKGSGHLLPVEAPQAAVESMQQFLQTLEPLAR